MSHRRRIFIATHIAGAITGMAVGLWLTKSTLTRIDDQITDLMLSNRYAQLPELQREMGGPNEYRDALLSNLARWDEEAHRRSDQWLKDTFLYDKALTYVRLSRLERNVGNGAASQDYLKRAELTCAASSRPTCKLRYLKWQVRRLDRLNRQKPFAPARGQRTAPSAPAGGRGADRIQ